jgi:hypothetical protein
VDTALVVKVLGPIWKTKAETASRLRGRIESILDWATGRQPGAMARASGKPPCRSGQSRQAGEHGQHHAPGRRRRHGCPK